MLLLLLESLHDIIVYVRAAAKFSVSGNESLMPGRGLDGVVEELVHVKVEHGTRVFFFADDWFISVVPQRPFPMRICSKPLASFSTRSAPSITSNFWLLSMSCWTVQSLKFF